MIAPLPAGAPGIPAVEAGVNLGGTINRRGLGLKGWIELERLVENAEKEPQLARALRHCRSNPELVLASKKA